MESRRGKKQISAACHYAYTRLALNYYMYYEVVQEKYVPGGRISSLNNQYHSLMKGFLEGSCDIPGLDSLRNEVISVMEVNTAYTDAFQAYEYVLNRMESRFEPQIIGSRSALADEERMTSEIMAYITDTDESVVVNERIQSVLGQLPVRLTRQKFFAMVEQGLWAYKGGTRKSLEDMLYILRSEAMLNRPDDMETGYEELHLILKEFEQADYREMSAEQYRGLTSQRDHLSRILMDTTNEIMLFMDLVNDLYVLMLSRQSAMMEVIEENRLRALLGDLLSLFEAGASDAIPQEITDSLSFLEGKQETYFEQWMKYESSDEKKTPESERDGQRQILRTIGLLMSGSSFMSLDPEREEEKSDVDQTVLKQKQEEFFGELSASWEGKPKPLVRAVMAKILSRLPVFFESLEEVRLYISGSLRSCSDAGEVETSMKLIRLLMELDGFDIE